MSLFFVLFLIVLVFFWVFSSFNDSESPKKRPSVKMVRDAMTFDQIFDSYRLAEPYSLVIDRSSDRGQIRGAAVRLNKADLTNHWSLIDAGYFKRTADLRRQRSAPGMNAVRYEKANGESLYHLTHLIAFRHSLSDGDLPGLLFTGTAHLNMGSRPQLGYVVPSEGIDSLNYRVDCLIDEIRLSNWRQGHPVVLYQPRLVDGLLVESGDGPQLSLDDFERLFDRLMAYYPNQDFQYAVKCCYKWSSDTIPEKVIVRITNCQFHKLLIEAHLDNCL